MGGKLSQRNGRRMAGGKPIPKSKFALPGAKGGKGAYPVDTVKRARNALSRVAQYGTPEEKARVRRAVKRTYPSVGQNQDHTRPDGSIIDLDWAAWDAGQHGGGKSESAHDKAHATASATAKRKWMTAQGGANAPASGLHGKKVVGMTPTGNQVRGIYNHNAKTVNTGSTQIPVSNVAADQSPALSNSYGGGTMDFAGSQMQCPRCGYKSDDADFSVSGGASGTDSPGQPEQLRTRAADTGSVRDGVPLSVRGAGSANMGLANGRQRSVNLARPAVRSADDLMVSRDPADGSAVVRHRQGGAEIGRIRHTGDGWVPQTGGRALTPHTHQRAALVEMLGVYNAGSLSPERRPLQERPQQTPLMQQFGVPAIRLASDDMDPDDGSDDGLNPKGQAIYKKLCGKGVSPKVAMVMAKRAQNGPPGRKAS